jgi:drug/metabolite transporter (DMT)-like permease
MGILLGLAAALLYGSSDFGGGLLSRRFGSVTVSVMSSTAAAGLAWTALLLSSVLSDGPGPSVRAVVWGLVSGLGGGVGSLALYRGLARGQMSVVGPVSAVGAAVIPVIAGLAMGEHPDALSAAGLVLALPAIALVASSGSSIRGMLGAGLADGLIAGVAFGVLFVGLAQAGQHSGLWPVASEQTSSLIVIALLALKAGQPLRMKLRDAGGPVLVGASGMAATLLFFYASHFSMLATAAVLVSLYPGVTVLLARTILHERFTTAQRAGLGLCTVAVIAIALH